MSLNPQLEDQECLAYGCKYKLWRNGKYIGVATWTKDDNFGDVNYYIDDMDNSYKDYTDSLDENDYKHLR